MVIPPNPSTVRGEPSFIEASNDKLLYFNGSTVILRPLDNAPCLYINHTAPVRAVKFSHAFKYVASID